MSQHYELGKEPESPEERQQLLGQREQAEQMVEAQALTHVQAAVLECLIEQKGYAEQEIVVNVGYPLTLADGTSFQATADLVVVLNNRSYMAIKCAMSSLESWDRYLVAFCRVAASCRIPWAVISDGTDVRRINTFDGTADSGHMALIPDRAAALAEMEKTSTECFSAERSEREKRILYAFDAIRCPTLPTGYPKQPHVR
ncbi:MAG TPA: type I restriction enzyme HsdR N-terminal domain-containing protein [Dissulfurispiraceae bacterium]|nr:type I restriction enzyme HsdR N-terminal domain-containing protein [Dissulfurispiraceae bacterium]